jgi:hypothetical protein
MRKKKQLTSAAAPLLDFLQGALGAEYDALQDTPSDSTADTRLVKRLLLGQNITKTDVEVMSKADKKAFVHAAMTLTKLPLEQQPRLNSIDGISTERISGATATVIGESMLRVISSML